MVKLSFRRKGHGLYPSDDVTSEWMEEVQQEIEIVGELRVPRNARNHRHLMAILHEAVQSIDGFGAIDNLLEFLKLKAGMYKVVSSGVRTTRDGSRIQYQTLLYESLNFESMDEVRFKRVKRRFLWILQEEFGFEPSELEDRAMSQLAAYGAPAKRERK